jgi:hypothetical protein
MPEHERQRNRQTPDQNRDGLNSSITEATTFAENLSKLIRNITVIVVEVGGLMAAIWGYIGDRDLAVKLGLAALVFLLFYLFFGYWSGQNRFFSLGTAFVLVLFAFGAGVAALLLSNQIVPFSGSITGSLSDGGEQPLAHTVIEIIDSNFKRHTVQTNAQGEYRLDNLPSGPYRILENGKEVASGFIERSILSVHVNIPQIAVRSSSTPSPTIPASNTPPPTEPPTATLTATVSLTPQPVPTEVRPTPTAGTRWVIVPRNGANARICPDSVSNAVCPAVYTLPAGTAIVVVEEVSGQSVDLSTSWLKFHDETHGQYLYVHASLAQRAG